MYFSHRQISDCFWCFQYATLLYVHTVRYRDRCSLSLCSINTCTQCYPTYVLLISMTLSNSEGSCSLQGLLLFVKIFFSVKFDWHDALNLESLLLEDEIIMRDQFRQYCRDKLFPRVLESNRHEGMCIGFIRSSVYNYCLSNEKFDK